MSVDFSRSHKAMDVKEHERTSRGFVKWSVFFTAHALVLLALLAILLV
jgi:hypothetical protein